MPSYAEGCAARVPRADAAQMPRTCRAMPRDATRAQGTMPSRYREMPKASEIFHNAARFFLLDRNCLSASFFFMSVFFPFLPSLFFRLTKYSETRSFIETSYVLAFTLFEVCIFLFKKYTHFE